MGDPARIAVGRPTDRNFLSSTSNVPHLATRDLDLGMIDSRPIPSI